MEVSNGPRRAHFVKFLSPGTFVHETSQRPIASWDPALAIETSRDIIERYGARPFAFQFLTQIVHDPIPDGEGGTLEVLPKQVAASGRYFLGGRLRALSDLEAHPVEDEQILRENMRANAWPVVVENTNSNRVTQPFEVDDVIVDPVTGAVMARGDFPVFVEMREELRARREAQAAQFNAAMDACPPGHRIVHLDGNVDNYAPENIRYVERRRSGEGA